MIRTLLGLGILGLLLLTTARAADKKGAPVDKKGAAPADNKGGPVDDGPVDKEAVNKAIDKGVAFLKQAQEDGKWSFAGDKLVKERTTRMKEKFSKEQWESMIARGNSREELGVTALAGWALLESGVPVKDPVLKKAADFVRKYAPESTFTYGIAISILFLDRINDAEDNILIKTLAARLLAGKIKNSGWTYNCPKVAADDVRRWKTSDQFLDETDRLVKDVRQHSDNSNSQFAIMGLWVARRHQVPVSQALSNYENVCRKCQRPDGDFIYHLWPDGSPGPGTPCMTCVGLLGLAYSHGAANEAARACLAPFPPPLVASRIFF